VYRDKGTISTHFHSLVSVSVNEERPQDVPRSDLAAAYFSLDRRSLFNDDSSFASNNCQLEKHASRSPVNAVAIP